MFEQFGYAKYHRLRSHLKQRHLSIWFSPPNQRALLSVKISYMVTVTVACVLVFLTISENKKQKTKTKRQNIFCNCWFNIAVSLPLASTIDRFHYCHAKKNNKLETVQWKKPIPTLRPLWPTVSRTFVELCMQTPY